jgi:hypothetical protein
VQEEAPAEVLVFPKNLGESLRLAKVSHMNSNEHAVIGSLFSDDIPRTNVFGEELVRSWVDDGQDGGWFEWVTKEEDARREAIIEADGDRDWEG